METLETATLKRSLVETLSANSCRKQLHAAKKLSRTLENFGEVEKSFPAKRSVRRTHPVPFGQFLFKCFCDSEVLSL